MIISINNLVFCTLSSCNNQYGPFNSVVLCHHNSSFPPSFCLSYILLSHLLLCVSGDADPLVLLNTVGPEVSQVLCAVPAPKKIHRLCRKQGANAGQHLGCIQHDWTTLVPILKHQEDYRKAKWSWNYPLTLKPVYWLKMADLVTDKHYCNAVAIQ